MIAFLVLLAINAWVPAFLGAVAGTAIADRRGAMVGLFVGPACWLAAILLTDSYSQLFLFSLDCAAILARCHLPVGLTVLCVAVVIVRTMRKTPKTDARRRRLRSLARWALLPLVPALPLGVLHYSKLIAHDARYYRDTPPGYYNRDEQMWVISVAMPIFILLSSIPWLARRISNVDDPGQRRRGPWDTAAKRMLATAGVPGPISSGLTIPVLACTIALSDQLGWTAFGLMLVGGGVWVVGHAVAATLLLTGVLIEVSRSRWHVGWAVWAGGCLGMSMLILLIVMALYH